LTNAAGALGARDITWRIMAAQFICFFVISQKKWRIKKEATEKVV
jgi:hypothetical protein